MPNLSLEELDNLPPGSQQQTPPVPPIKPGDGTPSPADLEAERIKQQKVAEEAEKNKTPATPGTGADGGAQKTQAQLDQEAANIAAGKNADGTEKTAEQIKQEKLDEEAAAAEEAEEMKIWDDVDKLWGEPLKVEYKLANGDEVHPNSPEGVFLREQAIAQRGAERFEEYIAKTDPRSYEYFLHRQAGGKDDDFFNRKTVTLPVYEELKGSVDLQSRVLTESLRIKGVPEKQIKLIVDTAVKDKEIEALADSAYKEVELAQKAEIDRLNQQNANQKAAYDRSMQVLDKSLNEEMATGMKIIIPEAQKAAFGAYVRERIQTDGQGFMIVNPIDTKSLPQLLDALYFQFAKGNLSDLVVRQAQTSNAARFRRHVETSKKAPKAGEQPENKKKTLGEL